MAARSLTGNSIESIHDGKDSADPVYVAHAVFSRTVSAEATAPADSGRASSF